MNIFFKQKSSFNFIFYLEFVQHERCEGIIIVVQYISVSKNIYYIILHHVNAKIYMIRKYAVEITNSKRLLKSAKIGNRKTNMRNDTTAAHIALFLQDFLVGSSLTH